MDKTDQAIIAETKPAKVDLKAGEKYFWCACGRSGTQPVCDGSPRVTTITPLTVPVEEDSEAFLVHCTSPSNPPHFDRPHARLGSAKVGDVSPQAKQDGPPKAVPTPEEPTVARHPCDGTGRP